ncbi:hypothetical protein K2173_013753 [Erythroxylum novogranatense]|uniref:Exocyst component Exo84 C-terminal domain-containing protein n=1 Tax=Erythroxylum novogranatense TaxID=1862640 RepID=A0AAV8SAU6_9ROSI|nr:hypothetical protein K2173_013753 [Erythroxylum novogranatense]
MLFLGEKSGSMEASSASRFRFRDHVDTENATYTSSDISSVFTEEDDDDEGSELESMTAKGIKRLCTELLEIKEASDEDFHRNIMSSYSAFVGILDEVKDMEKELLQLRTNVSTQKRLVKELSDGVYLKVFSDETIQRIIRDAEDDELAPPTELETQISDVSETLDVLLSENRIYEAISVIEMEEENIQRVELEGNTPSDVLMLYNSAISERKAMLTLQLTLVAENPRIGSPELQKSLIGLCRLGEGHLATQLLIKYYHTRVASGIRDLRNSKSFLHVVYIKELSKCVFSMISQAARSFILLYGETSSYAPEFIQWAQEEIEILALSLAKYVISVSEISGGLSTAIEAVQFAISYCCLLENQRLLLQPCLIEHVRPCMEEVLQKHIEHFAKVISIFTATDAWVLGRYLVSGILNDSYSYMVVGQQPEYCMLTNSGRKFITLLQAITEDVSALVSVKMGDAIIRGLTSLFMEYLSILETAITTETKSSEKGASKIILAQSVQQQASILVNLSTLKHFFSNTVTSIFKGIKCTNSELIENGSVSFQQQELDSSLLLIEEASIDLRTQFCLQFICRVFSLKRFCNLTPEMGLYGNDDPHLVHDQPSTPFQVLFLELRKLDNLAEDDFLESNWLTELIRELIEAIFVWLSNNKEIWETNGKNLNSSNSDVFNQFVLDMHFMVEVAKYGQYFNEDPSGPTSLMKSAFVSAGLDPEGDTGDVKWAVEAGTKAIKKLVEMDITTSPSHDEIAGDFVGEPAENRAERANETFKDAVSSIDSLQLEEDEEDSDTLEVVADDMALDDLKGKRRKDENSRELFGAFEDNESEEEAYDMFQETSSAVQLLSADVTSEAGSNHKETQCPANKMEPNAESESRRGKLSTR